MRVHLEGGDVVGARHRVVHERAGQELARLVVVGEHLEESLAEALHDPAVDLALHEHRVDHPPDVVDDGVAHDTNLAGFDVDLHLADLRAVRERHRRRRERRRLAQPGLEARRELLGHIGRACDGGQRHAAVGAGHGEACVAPDDVLVRRFHQMRGDAPATLDHLLRRARHRRSADAQRSRATITPARAQRIAVAPQHLDTLGRHAEPIAHDLSEGRLVALAHRRRTGEDRHRAVGIHADLGRVGV